MNYLNISVPMADIAAMSNDDFGALLHETIYRLVRLGQKVPSERFVEDVREQLEDGDIVWLKALVEALEEEPQP